MPATYIIDKQRGLVLSTATGTLSSQDLRDHAKRLNADPDFTPDQSQLFDMTLVTKVELTADALRELAVCTRFSSRSRRALVIKQDVLYGMARMWAAFHENEGAIDQVKIFEDRGVALRWLDTDL
jgi:hypothetical protein